MEVDAVHRDDMVLLPPQRRLVIESLPSVGNGGEAIEWLPHLHLCVSHPGLDEGQLRAEFEKRWPGAGRVDVKAFASNVEGDGDSAAASNASNVVGYALKHVMKTTFSDPIGQWEPVAFHWPAEWQAIYHVWLYSCGRGLQALEIVLNAQKGRTGLVSLMPGLSRLAQAEPMPMPMTNVSFAMSF